MIAFLLLVALASQAEINQAGRYEHDGRVQAIQRALMAFNEAPSSMAENTLRLLRGQSQYKCAATSESLKIQCLMEIASMNCKGRKPACLEIADVIVSNMIEEDTFVTRDQLHHILRHTRSGGDQMMIALTGRYSRLTTDYMRADRNSCGGGNWPCLASSIDNFCMKISSEKKMSWQGCAGAIVWSIGRYQAKK